MKKCLIVDDEAQNRYLLEKILQGFGYRTTIAENGAEALDKARQDPPDLIITDILMPVMDGYALCLQWKSDDHLKHIPLIFYTATYTEPKDEAFALSLGADRFILKPQEPNTLMNIIRKVLEENHEVKQVAVQPLGEEMEFFRRHNEILFKKLEKKMLDLEAANQRLKCLEEQYRLSFENVADIVWTTDTELIIRIISPSIEKMLGYKPQNLIGQPMSDLLEMITPELAERAMAEMRLVLDGQTISASVYPLVARDGSIRYCEIGGSPILHNGGEIVGMISVVRDITERKRAEEALMKSEEHFRAITENANDVLFIVNEKGNITYCSLSVERIAGYKPQELIGLNALDLIIPEDHARANKDFGKALRTQNTGIQNSFRVRHKNGSVLTMEGIGKNLFHNPAVAGFVMNIQDVSERKRAEEKLHDAYTKRQELEFIVDHSPAIVWLWKAAEGWPVEYVSGNINLYGYMADDFTSGRVAFASIVHPEDFSRVGPEVEQYTREGRTEFSQEYRILTKSGDIRWFDDRTWVRRGPDGLVTHYQGIALDITDRKRMEEALRRSEENFRLSIDNSPLGMRIASAEGETLYANRAILDIYGYDSSEELNSISTEKRYTPESYSESLIRQAKRKLGVDEQSEYEISIIKKDGDVRRLQVFRKPILWNGKMQYQTIYQDITDRRRAEEMLLKSEASFQELFNEAPVGYFEYNAQGCITRVNQTELEMLGYSSEEVIGQPAWKFIVEEETGHQHILAKLAGILSPFKGFEREYRRKDGTISPFLIQDRIITDERGNITGIRCTLQDITELKRKEKQLRDTLATLRKSFGTIIQVMVSAVETRDPYTAGHQTRSAGLARAIAMEMGLPQEKIEGIRMAGSIHDIGKLSIPAEILTKPVKLTEIEFSLIKEHSRKGYEILKDIESPWPLAQIVYQHHERMDGSGYPRNLKGDEIIMEARIMAVADVVESISSYRPYRPALGINSALEEIEKNKGTLYDTDAVDACLRLFREKDFKIEET